MSLATFDYQVRDRAGKVVRGRIDAESPTAVASKLKSMGYAPISITQANAGLNKEIKIPGVGNKVKLKDLAVSARQFATMINSGLSLLRALAILSDQTENKALAEVYGSVRLAVEQGSSLSQALGQHLELDLGDGGDMRGVQAMEHHRLVDPVQELGPEMRAHHSHHLLAHDV